MRIRQKDTTTSSLIPNSENYYVPTVENGPFGYRAIVPRKLFANTVFSTDTSFIHGRKERIEDEVPYREFIGNVDHQVGFVAEPKAIPYIYVSGGTMDLRLSYGASMKNILPVSERSSIQKLDSARNWAYSQKPFDAYNVYEPAIAAGGRSDDRLPELIPKIMSKLNNLALANTLWETQEFPSLYKMFSRRESLARGLGRLINYGDAQHRRRLRGIGGNSGFDGSQFMKDMSRAFREGNLNYAFGIMPTVGDMRAIYREIRKPVKMKTSFMVSVKDTFDSPFEVSQNVGIYDGMRTLVQNEKRQRIFGCRVEVQPPEQLYYTKLFQNLQNGMDRYLGYNPLGIAWEAIPYSFMLDWVLSLDNVLDSLFLNNNKRIKLQYWSTSKISVDRRLKYQALSKFETTQPVPMNSTEIQNIEFTDYVHSESYSRYKRVRREPPNPLQSLRVRGGTKQVFLAVLIGLGLKHK